MTDFQASDQFAEKTRDLLADLWVRKLPIIESRLALLDRAAQADPLGGELRLEAVEVAHKLAGSLGMFGFTEGTRIARQLEVTLGVAAPDLQRVIFLTQSLRDDLFPSGTASIV